MDLIDQIPVDLINFLLVTIFSLLIGLEQRNYHIEKEDTSLFGTDRTFTLIGILGYILFVISPGSFLPFLAGAIVISALLAIYYTSKIKMEGQFGLTSIIVALITYCLAPLIYLQPPWLVLSIVVTVLIFVEIKEDLLRFSKKIQKKEFTTLAKFIIIAGIVLPLLPRQPISEQIQISAYQIWLAIVAVSAISYLSYIIKNFVFPKSGTILTAILGGLYSSTATTLILAKRSKDEDSVSKTPAGIMYATGMMYIRILALATIFNQAVALKMWPFFIVLAVLSAVLGRIFLVGKSSSIDQHQFENARNPLEFRTALIFGILFSIFSLLTSYVIQNYGNLGVGILSIIVGITDIDPYILGLFQGSAPDITTDMIVLATITATASNNLLKMIYTLALGNRRIRFRVILGFTMLILMSAGELIFI